MTNTVIKPCPFCEWEDVLIGEIAPGHFAVDCPECECIGPFGDTVDEAVEAWNRAARTEQAGAERDPLQTELEL